MLGCQEVCTRRSETRSGLLERQHGFSFDTHSTVQTIKELHTDPASSVPQTVPTISRCKTAHRLHPLTPCVHVCHSSLAYACLLRAGGFDLQSQTRHPRLVRTKFFKSTSAGNQICFIAQAGHPQPCQSMRGVPFQAVFNTSVATPKQPLLLCWTAVRNQTLDQDCLAP